MMKVLSIIIISFILAFTAQPLLNHIVHAKQISIDAKAHECCGQCSGSCCGDTSEKSCDTNSHDCTEECTCVMDGVVVFTHTISPKIHLYETILEKIGSKYTSYQFALPASIWNPPQ